MTQPASPPKPPSSSAPRPAPAAPTRPTAPAAKPSGSMVYTIQKGANALPTFKKK
jgi:hypothetical protein